MESILYIFRVAVSKETYFGVYVKCAIFLLDFKQI